MADADGGRPAAGGGRGGRPLAGAAAGVGGGALQPRYGADGDRTDGGGEDGRTIVFAPVSPKTSGDIFSVAGRSTAPKLLIQSPRFDLGPRVAPNGRWLAYASLENGPSEIYVRPFPNVNDGSWKISVNGGRDPRWSAKGDELFYTQDRAMYRASVATTGTAFIFTTPEVLFKGDFMWSLGRHNYDLAPDRRFLMMKDVPGNASIQVVLNWLDEVKAKLP